VALRVHHWQGGFWLEVPREAAGLQVELDGRPLGPGTSSALQAAHQLRLGSLQFEVKVAP
jgi:predicted component of type VI protein secretion system